MRNSIIAAILFLLGGALGFCAQPCANAQANRADTPAAVQTNADWIKYDSPGARFSLLLPKAPKVEVVPNATDEKLSHNRFSDIEDGYGFVIEAFENIQISDPEKYLDGARQGIIDTIHGTLIREEKISLDGYPGRELEFSLPATNGIVVAGRTRLFAVGNSLYSMSFLWRTELDQTKAAKIGEKYFSSIKVYGPK